MKQILIVGFFVCLTIPLTWQYNVSSTSTMRDYLLVSANQTVFRIDLKTQEISDLNIADANQIEFDVERNQLFYVENGTYIVRKCFNTNNTAERLAAGSISSISYDWISEQLYFIDLNSSSIKAIKTSLNSTGMMRTVLKFPSDEIPERIVAHPKYGYLYWINKSASIKRANADGTDERSIVQFVAIGGIAIDYKNGRIYWTDANFNVGSSNLDGEDQKTIGVRQRTESWIAVVENRLYWHAYKALDKNIIYSMSAGM